MKTPELVFVGIKGSVVALDRSTGQQVWVARLTGGEFVNVLFDGGSILATSRGEVFCLDYRTGKLLRQNPLKGFGLGLATIATERASQVGTATTMAYAQDQDAAAAAGGSIV